MPFKTVYLFASGDLRESANKVCWPAQQAMEAQLGQAVGRLGATLKRAHPIDTETRPRLPVEPAPGHGRLRPHPRRRAGHRRRGRVAVFAPRPSRADPSQGADPDRRQLVGAMARPCRHAQPQRFADQGRRALFDPVEPRLHRRLLQCRRSRPGWRAAGSPTTQATSRALAGSPSPRGSQKVAADIAADMLAPEAHHGRLRRGLHGHVQRHRARPPAQSRSASSRSGCRSRRSITRRRRSPTPMPTKPSPGSRRRA